MGPEKKKRKADARVTKQKMNSSSAVIWPGPNLQRHKAGGADGAGVRRFTDNVSPLASDLTATPRYAQLTVPRPPAAMVRPAAQATPHQHKAKASINTGQQAPTTLGQPPLIQPSLFWSGST